MAAVLRAPSRLFNFSKNILRKSLAISNLQKSFSTTSRVSVAGIDDDLYALTDDQKDFRQTVHDFCMKELAPYSDQIDKDNGWSEMR